MYPQVNNITIYEGDNEMRTEKHMSHIRTLDERPYIQIPKKLAKEVTRDCKYHKSQSYSHYAYSFLVLNGFLYKYANYINMSTKEYINAKDIKEILKYNPRNQKLDIVSKRDTGILEQEGHVLTTTDIPIMYKHRESDDKVYDDREIIHLNDVDDELSKYIYSYVLRTPNYFVSIPTFMIDSKKEKGTLNNYENTFRLNYSEFEYFIFNDEFNLREFFIYCYIKSSSNKYGLAEISYDKFKRQTGISQSTITKIICHLQEKEIVEVVSSGNKSYKNRISNKYRIKGEFLDSLY